MAMASSARHSVSADPTATRSAASPSPTARTEGWAWRWTGWASWPLRRTTVGLAAVIVAVDAVTAWTGIRPVALGPATLSPAWPLALVLVLLVGTGALGASRRQLLAWREFLVGGGVITGLAVAGFVMRAGSWSDAGGLVVAAAGEELVYRFAATLVIGAVLAHVLGRPRRDTARWGTPVALGAVVGASVLFASLPGHVDQMTGLLRAMPFVAFGIVVGYVALRTGSLLPGVIVHLMVNVTALSYQRGALDGDARGLLAAAMLGTLVLAGMLAGRRLGLRRRLPEVIHLRADESIVASSVR
jgi:membrane protease YdiL (CAAX protease family)